MWAELSVLLPVGPSCVGFNRILDLRMGTNPFHKTFFFLFAIFNMRRWTECLCYNSKWIYVAQDRTCGSLGIVVIDLSVH